jgi:3-methylcrotonyl-CoA carboxylase beta subunit
LAGPPLVKAATGEVITAEELGGGHTHTKISGVCDYLALDEFDAIDKTRKIFETVDKKFEIDFNSIDHNQKFHVKECERLYDPDLKDQMDVKELIFRLTDGH